MDFVVLSRSFLLQQIRLYEYFFLCLSTGVRVSLVISRGVELLDHMINKSSTLPENKKLFSKMLYHIFSQS